MDINWQTDRDKVKDGGTYLITEIVNGNREVFFEDSFDEEKKIFSCEFQLGEDNIVAALAAFEDVKLDESQMHKTMPPDGDYHLIAVKNNDGSVSLNVDLFFAKSGEWGSFEKEEVAGWFDWPNPYMGPILPERNEPGKKIPVSDMQKKSKNRS